MALDLRKQTPVAPSSQPARPSQALPGNGLPLPTGSVLSLSPEEEATLKKLNWKKGDPIPDVAAAIAQIKLEEQTAMPDASLPPVVPGKVVDFADLTPEQQQKLEQDVASMIEAGKRLEAIQSSLVDQPSDPSVNRAIETLQAGRDQFNVTMTPEVKTEDEPDTMRTAADVKHICDNCGWGEETEQSVVEVTDLDKQNFLSSVIGGSRFVREYTLFGGQVVVAFRSLTQRETDLIITQTAYDDSNGELPQVAYDYEFMRRVNNYKMVLSLCRIKLGEKVERLPEISEVKADPKNADGKPQTSIKDYYKYVMETCLDNESLFRSVLVLRDRFANLQRRLEANMFNADFYKGIVPHA